MTASAGLAGKISEEALARVVWDDVIVRLTAFAHQRLRRRSAEDAKRLAYEAIRIFLDPESTVVWDHEREPDPLPCLGSIVNGLVRNHFRKKSNSVESTTDDVESVPHAEREAVPNQEDAVINADLFRKVLNHVYENSDGDDLVQQMAILAGEFVVDVEDQVTQLRAAKAQVYEARRRFSERIQLAVQSLEGR